MTTGRNDPCPCGSGKKYKKCCMAASQVVSLQQFRDRRTSDNLLDRLTQYVKKETHEVAMALPRFFGGHPPDDGEPEELALPMDWIMFHYKSPKLGTLLCQQFAERTKDLTSEERTLVAGWSMALPGFYHVARVDADVVSLSRLGDQATYTAAAGGTDVTVGDLVMASLLPLTSGYRFGRSVFLLPKETARPLEHLLHAELGILRRQRPSATWDDLYRTCWPRLVDDARIAEHRGEGLLGVNFRSGQAVQGTPVDDPKDRAVADRLVREMLQGKADPEEVEGGLRLWWDLVHAVKPRISRVEPWVGGLIYVISNRVYCSDITQGEAAELLGISAGTVGSRARQIEDALAVDRVDERYVDLLNPFVRSEWRVECLTLTKDGTHDYRLLRGFPWDRTEAPYEPDPVVEGSEMFQAADLVDEAWEATGKRRVQLAQQALQLWPDATDAYVILGNDALQRHDLQEARRLFTEGVQAGERDLGSDFFTENAGQFWGLFESRPYMRALFGLADSLWQLGERDEALARYAELLRLNPNDNQGVRYVLAGRLLEIGDDERLGKLLQAHADDGMATMVYTRALWEFRKHGPGRDADRWLKDALKQNPHIPAYLLKERKLPKKPPEYIGFGDETEAHAYALDFAAGWRQTPGALEWLAAHAGR